MAGLALAGVGLFGVAVGGGEGVGTVGTVGTPGLLPGIMVCPYPVHPVAWYASFVTNSNDDSCQSLPYSRYAPYLLSPTWQEEQKLVSLH